MDPIHYSKLFSESNRPHIMNITNHGIHEWEITPGLTDTGGQNVFVNQISDALTQQNFKVTIINRGGYPHPTTGKLRTGIHYKNPYQRIYYLEDALDKFVRKEDMGDIIAGLTDPLIEFIKQDQTQIDLLFTHYWDAGILGKQLKKTFLQDLKHIWIPHSLGAIKDRMLTEDQREGLRIEERMEAESEILKVVDGVGVTSHMIQSSLTDDYGYKGKAHWLPPCVVTDRYYPRQVSDQDGIWDLLAETTGLPKEEIRKRKIITEISRTDRTKRKDVLIKAFAEIHKQNPQTLLIVAIDINQSEIADELIGLINKLNLQGAIAAVGSIWRDLPSIYNITDIYCTPSIMEGFGMSAQEAAASKVPIVASDKVVFVTEYLLGGETESDVSDNQHYHVGEGAIVVPVDDVAGFSAAVNYLLENDEKRRRMGETAYNLTIPYFSYENIIKKFVNELGF
jgi:mannosylfructose-phosphate synthase